MSRRRYGTATWVVVTWMFTASFTNASAIGVPCATVTLDNGLEVYHCTSNWESDYVAVRLIVYAPPCLPGSSTFGVFRSLALSMFDGYSEADDLFAHLHKTAGFADVFVDYDSAVFSFDILPEQLDSLFLRIARQWETGLLQDQIDCGYFNTVRFHIGAETPAIEELVFLTDYDWDQKYTANSVSVSNLFRSHMNAGNMALVIAGSRSNVDRAISLAERLERIPESRPCAETPMAYGDVLRGRIKSWWNGPFTIGLRVTVQPGANPAVSDFYHTALLRKLNDVISYRKGLMYTITGNLSMGPGEHIMVFEPVVDADLVDYDDLAQEMKRVVAELAEPSAISWWANYTEGERRNTSRFWTELSDASAVADAVVELAVLAHMDGREELGEEYLPTAKEARAGFARMLESSEWFTVEPGYYWRDALAEIPDKAIGFIYGDLFGPTDDRRALAVLCQCLLGLLVFRGLEKRLQRQGRRSVCGGKKVSDHAELIDASDAKGDAFRADSRAGTTRVQKSVCRVRWGPF